ncbi:MAG: nitroreductase family protein [Thermodesulfobacteriota bacterium]
MIRRVEEKCNACMLCVKECVSGVMRERDGRPEIFDESLCNLCGHCVAVCPKSAVIHDRMLAADLRPANRDLLSPEALEETVRTRRSIRHYKKRPLAKKTVEKILDLARFAPTASNDQNVEYVVIMDPKVLSEISRRLFSLGEKAFAASRKAPAKYAIAAAQGVGPGRVLGKYLKTMDFYMGEARKGRDFILHNAPVLVLVAAPARAPFACDNCNIAAAVATHYAHTLGLGTCYIGFVTLAMKLLPGLRELCRVPKGKKVFASFVLGHPAYAHAFTTSRKPASVTWVEQE